MTARLALWAPPLTHPLPPTAADGHTLFLVTHRDAPRCHFDLLSPVPVNDADLSTPSE